MKCLSGCHVNTIGQRGNDQSGSVTQILVHVPNLGVCDSADSISLALGVVLPVELQLGLPLEGVALPDVLCDQLVHDISRVGVHGNQHHDLLPDRLV